MVRSAQASAVTLTLVVVLLSGYLIARAASGMWRLLDDTAVELPTIEETTLRPAGLHGKQHHGRGTNTVPPPLARAAMDDIVSDAGSGEGDTKQELDADRIGACDAGLRLLGSVVNAAHPDRSMAAVEVRGGTRVLRTGQRIGDSWLVSLGPRRAYLRGADGTSCLLRVTPEGPVSQAPAKPQSPSVARKSALTVAELAAGIRSLGGDDYAVSRSLLERALADPAALRRSARLQIVKKDGKVEGVRLSTLRAQSPLTFLGLQKDDVVRKLNGYDLADPAGALQAFAMLKSQGRVSLALLRGGAPRTLTYLLE